MARHIQVSNTNPYWKNDGWTAKSSPVVRAWSYCSDLPDDACKNIQGRKKKITSTLEQNGETGENNAGQKNTNQRATAYRRGPKDWVLPYESDSPQTILDSPDSHCIGKCVQQCQQKVAKKTHWGVCAKLRSTRLCVLRLGGRSWHHRGSSYVSLG